MIIRAEQVIADLAGECPACGRGKTGPKPKGPQEARYTLHRGDRAWNPVSDKPERMISGPASLIYRRWTDGGIDLEVTR